MGQPHEWFATQQNKQSDKANRKLNGRLKMMLAGSVVFVVVCAIVAVSGIVKEIGGAQDLSQNAKNNVIIYVILFSGVVILGLGGVFAGAYMMLTKKINNVSNQFVQATRLFDNALARGNCGIWDWDIARGKINWSDSMAKLLGDENINNTIGFKEIEEMMHHDDRDLKNIVEPMLAGKKKYMDKKFRMKHKNGKWIWIRLKAQMILNKDNEPHLTGIAVDVTEQEMLQQKSIEADRRLSNGIENISETFVLWDKEKKLVMCNSKYRELYNLPDEQNIQGHSESELMALDGKPRILKQVEVDVGNENEKAKNIEIHLTDGRWLQTSERQTQDGGVVSIGTDITQIKRNQEKLMDSQTHLKATLNDQRKQAEHLQEMVAKYNEEKIKAEEANEAKSAFLANMSHELRTPLNAIIGFSQIMKEGMLGPDKYGEYARDINDSGEFLLGVINDILDMSKIEAGRMQPQYEKVKLNEIIKETLPIVQVEADKSWTQIKCDVPEKLVIDADRRAIKQILLNLLSNAVKFTENAGKIVVQVRQRKNYIVIAIDDNGIGIDKDALVKLGQPFEQVQGQFTRDHKGSGLGLAIAASLVKMQNGKLKIRSKKNIGTLVVVKLPVNKTTSIQDENQYEIQQIAV